MIAELGRRSGRSLVDDIRRNGPSRPGFTPSTATAIGICIGVYAVVITAAVLSLVTLISGGFALIVLPFLLVGLLLPLVVRPQVPRADSEILDREELPVLASLIDAISDTVGRGVSTDSSSTTTTTLRSFTPVGVGGGS